MIVMVVIVVVMVVMMVMVVVVVVMVVMMVMVILGDDHRPFVGRGLRGLPLVLHLQNLRCIRDRIEQFGE